MKLYILGVPINKLGNYSKWSVGANAWWAFFKVSPSFKNSAISYARFCFAKHTVNS